MAASSRTRSVRCGDSALIVPIVLLLIAGLLYASFGTCDTRCSSCSTCRSRWLAALRRCGSRGLNLNLSASVGFIALFGVAVLNGVVLVAYINQLRATAIHSRMQFGMGRRRSTAPVLMTALVASVGFIPMAISTGAGAEIQRPLATVVIGGLISATALTLLVLPTAYTWIEERFGGKVPGPMSEGHGPINATLTPAMVTTATELR